MFAHVAFVFCCWSRLLIYDDFALLSDLSRLLFSIYVTHVYFCLILFSCIDILFDPRRRRNINKEERILTAPQHDSICRQDNLQRILQQNVQHDVGHPSSSSTVWKILNGNLTHLVTRLSLFLNLQSIIHSH